MKKKYLMLLPLMVFGLSLVACNKDKPADEPGNVDPKPNEPVNPNPPVEEDIYYSAKVLYPNGDPVTNTKVQWCTGNSCKSPVAVDSAGVAKYKLEDVDGGYYLHIAEGAIPTGYTYNPNIYTSDEGNRDIEIKLLKLETASGDGEKEKPYQLGVGAYSVRIESKGKFPYFVFTAPEAGTYEIESLAMDKLATVIVDPIYLPYDDSSFSNRGLPVSTGGTGKNFKTSFTVEKDGTVAFGISFNSSKDLFNKDVPAEFDIVITKK